MQICLISNNLESPQTPINSYLKYFLSEVNSWYFVEEIGPRRKVMWRDKQGNIQTLVPLPLSAVNQDQVSDRFVIY